MIRTHKFSTSLSGVIFLFVLLESIAAQSSNLQPFDEKEEPGELNQNIVPKKANERRSKENEAIEKYKIAIAAAPGNALLRNNLGVQYALLNRYEEAYEELRKSIEIDSHSADTLFNLSKVAEFLERFPEAIEAARQAIAIDVKHKRANIQLCRLFAVSESDGNAVKCYENFFTVFAPDTDAIAGYGIALIKTGNLKKASLALGEERNFYADNKQVQNALGILCFTKKKYKQAVKYFARAIELAPDYQAAHFNLAVVQLNKKDKRGAFDQYMILKKTNGRLAEKLYRYMYADKILYAGGK